MSLGKVFAPGNRLLVGLTCVAAVVALYGYLQPNRLQAGHSFYLTNTGGAVLFTHAGHQAHTDACVACHHALVRSDAYACSDCHDDPDYTHGVFDHDELLEIEDHTCDGCHEPEPDTAAVGCRTCHPAVADAPDAAADPADCQQCHDDPDYSPDEFTHADILEIEDHACRDCHGIRPVSEAYHQGCTACHRNQADDRFIDDQNKPVCQACHLK